MKSKIEAVKQQNPTWGYKRIASFLGIPYSLVRYHLNPAANAKAKERVSKFRKTIHPLYRKLIYFCGKQRKSNGNHRKDCEPLISLDDALVRFGPTPKCYLTGEPINLLSKDSYSLDHIIPVSQGGKSTLENLGLCIGKLNACKSDMSVTDFIILCKKVVAYDLTGKGLS